MSEADDTVTTTTRLRLRRWRAEDLDHVARLFADERVMRYIPVEPFDTRAKAEELLQRLLARQRETGLGFWPVLDRATGTFLGDCGLKPLDDGDEIEVGYHFLPEHWGRGYATEAARAALAHGFEVLGLERIVAVVLPENGASVRVLEKAGLRHAGRRRAYGHETVAFELTAAEWAQGPRAD